MRMMTLVCAGGLSLFAAGAAVAFDAAAPDAPNGASAADTKPNTAARARNSDPGGRSARSIECSQKADAQDLHGKPRKHFMHRCKGGL